MAGPTFQQRHSDLNDLTVWQGDVKPLQELFFKSFSDP